MCSTRHGKGSEDRTSIQAYVRYTGSVGDAERALADAELRTRQADTRCRHCGLELKYYRTLRQHLRLVHGETLAMSPSGKLTIEKVGPDFDAAANGCAEANAESKTQLPAAAGDEPDGVSSSDRRDRDDALSNELELDDADTDSEAERELRIVDDDDVNADESTPTLLPEPAPFDDEVNVNGGANVEGAEELPATPLDLLYSHRFVPALSATHDEQPLDLSLKHTDLSAASPTAVHSADVQSALEASSFLTPPALTPASSSASPNKSLLTSSSASESPADLSAVPMPSPPASVDERPAASGAMSDDMSSALNLCLKRKLERQQSSAASSSDEVPRAKRSAAARTNVVVNFGDGASEQSDRASPPATAAGSASAERRRAAKKRNSYSDSPKRVGCPLCPRAFPWVSSLKRHLVTHTGQKPYRCPRCALTFSTKSNRERHLYRKHGIVPRARAGEIAGRSPHIASPAAAVVARAPRHISSARRAIDHSLAVCCTPHIFMPITLLCLKYNIHV